VLRCCATSLGEKVVFSVLVKTSQNEIESGLL